MDLFNIENNHPFQYKNKTEREKQNPKHTSKKTKTNGKKKHETKLRTIFS